MFRKKSRLSHFNVNPCLFPVESKTRVGKLQLKFKERFRPIVIYQRKLNITIGFQIVQLSYSIYHQHL